MNDRRSALTARDALPLAAATVFVAAAYIATAARSVTRWDSGEFLAAVHSLGIPHPPGAAAYVLIARVWSFLPLPGSFAYAVNLFSVVCAVGALAALGILIRRWTGDAKLAAAAVLCAGGTSSLWLSATEAEVYAPALLIAVLLLLIADLRSVTSHRRLLLLAYVAGLGWALHPASLLTLPAAVPLLLLPRDASAPASVRSFVRPRVLAGVAAAALLGASVVLFLIVRAQHDPVINQGDPSTVRGLWSVLTREQYADAGLWPRQAPLWLQIGNWFEYADWQFALGLAPDPPPSWLRTPVTALFAVLGVAGVVEHRRRDRRGWWSFVVTWVFTTVALIAYLNLKAGPSFGHGVLAEGAAREARERDYFFVTGFVVWGAWAGMGAVFLVRRLLDRAGSAVANRLADWVGLAIAAAPLLLNFGLVRAERFHGSREVRRTALAMLNAVPGHGVLLAIGDNDTYPLWYAQVVEGARRDVTVVTIPLMAARWYREELHRRHRLLDDPSQGTSSVVAAVCRAAAARARPIALTPYADADTLTSVCPGVHAVQLSPSN